VRGGLFVVVLLFVHVCLLPALLGYGADPFEQIAHAPSCDVRRGLRIRWMSL
jgi:hypothetical protein